MSQSLELLSSDTGMHNGKWEFSKTSYQFQTRWKRRIISLRAGKMELEWRKGKAKYFLETKNNAHFSSNSQLVLLCLRSACIQFAFLVPMCAIYWVVSLFCSICLPISLPFQNRFIIFKKKFETAVETWSPGLWKSWSIISVNNSGIIPVLFPAWTKTK